MSSRESTSMFVQILRGSRWAMAGRCGAVAGLMGMNALLTRLLGPDEVGAFFLVFSIVVTAASFAQFGLPLAIVNLVGEAAGLNQPGRVHGAIRTTIEAASVALAMASVAMLAMGPALAMRMFHSPMVGGAMKIAAAWLAVRGLQMLLAEIFRALKDLRAATLHSGLLGTIVSVLAFAATWCCVGHVSISAALWISVGAGALDVAISSVVLRRRLRSHGQDTAPVSLDEIMRIAVPLWGALVVWTLSRENDVWVLGMFRTPEDVALYGAAARLAGLTSMPLMVVNAVVPPFIAELNGRRQTRDLEMMLRATATVALLPTLGVLAIFVLKGRPLLAALYGPFYADAYRILVVWGLSAVTDVATGACGLALMMTGRGSQVLWISMGGALLALAIKLALVRRYGGVGVAVGAAIGFTAQNLAMLLVVKRELGIWSSVLRPKDSAPIVRVFLDRLGQPVTT